MLSRKYVCPSRLISASSWPTIHCFNVVDVSHLSHDTTQPVTIVSQCSKPHLPESHWFTSAWISLIQWFTCDRSQKVVTTISNLQVQSPLAFLSTEALLWPHVGFITSDGRMLVNLFQPSMLGLCIACMMMGWAPNKDHGGSLGHLNKQPNGEKCKLIRKKHLFSEKKTGQNTAGVRAVGGEDRTGTTRTCGELRMEAQQFWNHSDMWHW